MKRVVIISIVVLLVALLPIDMFACPNCKSVTEGDSWSNRGLNTGILYLMSVPYLLIAVVSYFWYRQSKRNKEEQKRLASILKEKL
jgi:hypothetical protein